MPNKIISNTSVLIILDNIGMLTILKKLYEKIYITEEVYQEYGKNIEDWIKVIRVTDRKYLKTLSTFFDYPDFHRSKKVEVF